MTIKILVSGAHGKMGQISVATIEKDPRFILVGTTDRTDSLSNTIEKTHPDVVVDFTTPDAVFENAQTILKHKVHPVIGTTGLTEQQLNVLSEICEKEKIGAVVAPNFSLAVVLMTQFAKVAAQFFSDVEIIELHHPQKKDAPSGTALKTAEMIAEAQLHTSNSKEKNTITREESVAGARGALYKNIPIHSVRLPGMLAHEEIIFGSAGETLRLRQDSLDRTCFMPGLLLACERVIKEKKLIYGLEHLLDLKNLTL